MATYCLFDNIEIHDAEALQAYKKRVMPLLESYGGRYLSVGGRVQVLEGEWRPSLVLVEFPSSERALAWHSSTEYRSLKALRSRALTLNAVLLESK